MKSERKLTVVRKNLLFLCPTENDESIHSRNNAKGKRCEKGEKEGRI